MIEQPLRTSSTSQAHFTNEVLDGSDDFGGIGDEI